MSTRKDQNKRRHNRINETVMAARKQMEVKRLALMEVVGVEICRLRKRRIWVKLPEKLTQNRPVQFTKQNPV